MLSCFGTKSSSNEDVPGTKQKSKKVSVPQASPKIDGLKTDNYRQSSTSQSVFRSSITHSRTEFHRNTRSSSRSLSASSVPRRSNDAIMFRSPQPRRSLGQNPSPISMVYAQTSKNVNQKKKRYKVKKTNRLYDGTGSGRIPVYQTHSINRGRALIINNVKFHKEQLYRKGAKKDEKDMEDVLKQIGFQVDRHCDVKRSDIKKILKQFTKEPKLKKVDICVVVVMSHGTNNNIPGGYTELVCVDGEKISTEDIIEYFNESECISLKNKPKIFIFQCCRNSYETDTMPFSKKPQDKSNTLIAYSTIPGFSSNRDVEDGTWYIQTICQVFSEHAHEYHIEELLRLVDMEMKKLDPHMKQVSCFENRGFSRCYLHPR